MEKILIIAGEKMEEVFALNQFIRCLAKNNFQVDMFSSAATLQFFAGNPNVQKIISFDEIKSGVAGKGENYSVVYDFAGDEMLKYFKEKNKKDKEKNKDAAQTKIHELSHYPSSKKIIKALAFAAIQNNGWGWEFIIPATGKIKEQDIPTSHLSGYLIISVDGSDSYHSIKSWKKIVAAINHPIILIGFASQKNKASILTSIDPVKIYSAVGKFNLFETADLINRSKLVISHPNQWMLIGMALKKKIISINSSLTNPFIMDAYGLKYLQQQQTIPYSNVKLRPGWFYSQDKNVGKLLDAVNEMLKS